MKGGRCRMSIKSLDAKGRHRTETIAFRLSPEERKELDERVKLCGFQTKQEYILQSLLYKEVKAVGNPLMMTRFRIHLTRIMEELERINNIGEVSEDVFVPIRTMLEILNALSKEEVE